MNIYEPIYQHFDKLGITTDMYWAGPFEGADMQNGITFHEGRWVVYYRERGVIQNRLDFNTMGEAIEELESRLGMLIQYYQRYYNMN